MTTQDDQLKQLFDHWGSLPEDENLRAYGIGRTVSFSDLCCFMRHYNLYDPNLLDHFDLIQVWEGVQALMITVNDDETIDCDIDYDMWPTLIERIARKLYKENEGDIEEDGEENYTVELLDDLGLITGPAPGMKEFFSTVYEIDTLEEIYSYIGSLAAIFNHYVWPPSEDEAYVHEQNLERLVHDTGLVPHFLSIEDFLALHTTFGVQRYDFLLFVELWVACLLSVSSLPKDQEFSADESSGVAIATQAASSKMTVADSSESRVTTRAPSKTTEEQQVSTHTSKIFDVDHLSSKEEDEEVEIPEVMAMLKIPTNKEAKTHNITLRKLPFLKKLVEHETADDEERKSQILMDLSGHVPAVVPTPTAAAATAEAGASEPSSAPVPSLQASSNYSQPALTIPVSPSGKGPVASGSPSAKAASFVLEPLPPRVDDGISFRQFTPEEQANMRLEPPPFEEVMAKLRAKKKAAGGKKKKKKKKPSTGDDIPRPPPGTVVYLKRRPIKMPLKLPPEWDKFNCSNPPCKPARQETVRSASWLLRPSLIDEPFMLSDHERSKLPVDCHSFIEASIIYRNRQDLHRSFFNMWKARLISQNKILQRKEEGGGGLGIEGRRQGEVIPFKQPIYTDSFDIIQALREIVASNEVVKKADLFIEAFFILHLSSVASMMYQDSLALALAYKLYKLVRHHPTEILVLKQLGMALFRMNEHELAARCFFMVVKMQEKRLGDCNLDVATSYNNLATAYLMLDPPRNKEALAYYTLAEKVMSIFVPVTHPRIGVVQRNLEKVRECSFGRMFTERPYIWYVSLPGEKKVGKKKKKKAAAKKK